MFIQFYFIVYTIDRDAIANYKIKGNEFFALDNEAKSQFALGSDPAMGSRKKNKGYLHIEGMKEFLKVREPKYHILNNILEINSSYYRCTMIPFSALFLIITFEYLYKYVSIYFLSI